MSIRACWRLQGGFETLVLDFSSSQIQNSWDSQPPCLPCLAHSNSTGLHKLQEIRAALVQESLLDCVFCFRVQAPKANPNLSVFSLEEDATVCSLAPASASLNDVDFLLVVMKREDSKPAQPPAEPAPALRQKRRSPRGSLKQLRGPVLVPYMRHPTILGPY